MTAFLRRIHLRIRLRELRACRSILCKSPWNTTAPAGSSWRRRIIAPRWRKIRPAPRRSIGLASCSIKPASSIRPSPLRQAAQARPEDAAYQHNLGLAYRSAGRIDDAIDALRRAEAADPGGREVAVSLAQAMLLRNRAGDVDAAVELPRAGAREICRFARGRPSTRHRASGIKRSMMRQSPSFARR